MFSANSYSCETHPAAAIELYSAAFAAGYSACSPAAVDVDGAAGKPDAAQQQERQRDDQRGDRVDVAQRVEGQIALLAHAGVAAQIRHGRVRELVQAERKDPADQDEYEGHGPPGGYSRFRSNGLTRTVDKGGPPGAILGEL